jgi:radical SAM protein with 4Fe4S-binding SPASM domain
MIKNNDKLIQLSLQWHVTTNCSNRCKHCYLYDKKTFQNEKKNTLSLNDLIKILDNLRDFEKKYNVKFSNIAFSGGDPLLRKDIFDFFNEVKKRKINIIILGNPETINEKTIKKLKNLNINKFQMSLDGLEKTHDFFRSKGSFKRTIEKTNLLNKHDIRCNIMFTLFPNNARDLIPLMNYIVKYTFEASFSFDIGCFVGEGKNLSKNFTSKDLHKIFSDYFNEKNNLEKIYQRKFKEKSNFHKIIRLENNLLTQNFTDLTPVISGCLIGWHPPSILSDGSMLVCRRLPIIIGKMPESSFEDIFLGNSTLKKFRRRIYFTGCQSCDLYPICRGCPANVFSLTQNPFAKNPLCFRKELKNKALKNTSFYTEPDINTTYEEEWNFIASYYLYRQNYTKYLNDKDFQYLYIELIQDKNKKYQFLKNPVKYIKKNKYNLSKDVISWLLYNFGERLACENYDVKMDLIAKKAAQNIIEDIL